MTRDATLSNKKIIISEFGSPAVLKLVHESVPEPHRGHVRVRVEAAGVAYADLMMRKGRYPTLPPRPFTPGYDAVGIVDKVGPEVHQVREGDRVGVMTVTGSYARYVIHPAKYLLPLSQNGDPTEMVSLILNTLTAYQLLHRKAKVTSGEWLLVHSAAGGVGSALIQLGQLAGCTVLATTSSRKLDPVRQWGAIAIDYQQESVSRIVRTYRPGGVDVVCDPIGGSHLLHSYRRLNRTGRLVYYGWMKAFRQRGQDRHRRLGSHLTSLLQRFGHKPVLTYSISGTRADHPDWFQSDFKKVRTLYEQGNIQPVISKTLPLEKAGEAHRLLETGETIGKLVLIVD